MGKEPVLFQEDKSLLIKDEEEASGLGHSANSPRSQQRQGTTLVISSTSVVLQ